MHRIASKHLASHFDLPRWLSFGAGDHPSYHGCQPVFVAADSHEAAATGAAGGARHMAARLASLLPSVALVAVFTSPSEVMVYQDGHRRRLAVSL
jgi:hypothetical protein